MSPGVSALGLRGFPKRQTREYWCKTETDEECGGIQRRALVAASSGSVV